MSRWLVESSGGSLKSGSQVIPHRKIWGSHPLSQFFPFATVTLQPGDLLFVPATYWHLVESVPGVSGFSCAFNYFFSKDANQVIGQVQKLFSDIDDKVNDLQKVYRVKLASGSADSKNDKSIELPCPTLLSQEQWMILQRILNDDKEKLKKIAVFFEDPKNLFEEYKPSEQSMQEILEDPSTPEKRRHSLIPNFIQDYLITPMKMVFSNENRNIRQSPVKTRSKTKNATATKEEEKAIST